MSCTISISSEPCDIWIVNNRKFRRFAALMIEKFGNDSEIIFQVELAEVLNGISLDMLWEEQPQLAVRLAMAFSETAKEIVEQGIGSEDGYESPGNEALYRDAFTELIALIERFQRQ